MPAAFRRCLTMVETKKKAPTGRLEPGGTRKIGAFNTGPETFNGPAGCPDSLSKVASQVPFHNTLASTGSKGEPYP